MWKETERYDDIVDNGVDPPYPALVIVFENGEGGRSTNTISSELLAIVKDQESFIADENRQLLEGLADRDSQ